jgi:3-isopropylmalate/(R)-2-methylmalate dehydratase small subunit
MDAFTTLTAVAVPFDFVNVDTDRIIPARFLHKPRGPEYAGLLFHDVRFDEDGRERADFILNQPAFRPARILVANDNFGCGSSREHAVWSLAAYGIRAVIAPSFGDIFFNNCFKNALLPVVLQESEVDRLFYECASFPAFRLTIDLGQQTVSTADRSQIMRFEVDAFRKYSLLNGLDEIGLTLRHADKIRSFEAKRLAQQPWLSR